MMNGASVSEDHEVVMQRNGRWPQAKKYSPAMTDSGGVARKEQGAGGCTAPAVDDMPSIYTTRNLEEGRTQLQNLVSMPMHMFKPIDSLLCSSAQLGLTPVFLLSRFTTARTGKPST
jgi:hypothetical protein